MQNVIACENCLLNIDENKADLGVKVSIEKIYKKINKLQQNSKSARNI